MNNISLQILDKSKSFRNFKKDERYQLFLGIGEKRYTFKNKKKAEKFLVSFQNRLQTVLDEFQVYHSQIYTHYIESFSYLKSSQRKRFNDDFDHLIFLLDKLNDSHRYTVHH